MIIFNDILSISFLNSGQSSMHASHKVLTVTLKPMYGAQVYHCTESFVYNNICAWKHLHHPFYMCASWKQCPDISYQNGDSMLRSVFVWHVISNKVCKLCFTTLEFNCFCHVLKHFAMLTYKVYMYIIILYYDLDQKKKKKLLININKY